MENIEQLLRHTLAHLTAASVIELYPGAQNAIGPAVENGFYQDFELPLPISDSDLRTIEIRMREKLKTWNTCSIEKTTAPEARKLFAWNKYKTELINDFESEGKEITLTRTGDFLDLCKGGHLDDLTLINPDAFRLTRIAGAYWKGDEDNVMLTRIYGIAFATKDELESHLTMLAEAEKRDHRKLGRELDLFIFSDLVGSGLALWTPRGTLLRTLLDEFVAQLRKERGYEYVTIPHISKKSLYEVSGHWDKFQNDLFKIKTREGHEFAMKPMNCPHHIQLFARKPFSYREMPQRYAETTMCYRDEQTGELHGLSRVRAFTQDDAHVFCRESQLDKEIMCIWDIINEFYETLGFKNLAVRLSLHDPSLMNNYLGTEDMWTVTEDRLRTIAKQRGKTTIDAVGEAAFYGPKLDFLASDSIGREWQVATIQIDFNQPERFDLTCINEKGEHERISMVHAAIMGSIERFLSIYIEHCAGAFPVWLSPVQVALLPVGEAHHTSARDLAELLQKRNIRSYVDDANESVGKKIRNAEKSKIPYMVVIGEKEKDLTRITVRMRGSKDTVEYTTEDFIGMIKTKIDAREI